MSLLITLLSHNLILAICATFGVLAQIPFLIGKLNWDKLKGVLITAFVSFFLAIYISYRIFSSDITAPIVVLIWNLCFISSISLYFIKQIIPEINPITVGMNTLIFWFIIVNKLELDQFTKIVIAALLVIALLISVLTLLVLIAKIQMNYFLKLLFYAWFLVTNTVILFASLFALADDPHNITETYSVYPTTFFAGFTITILVSNLWQVILLLPIIRRGQTIQMRLQEIKEYTALLVEKFSSTSYKPIYTLLFILVATLLLLANHKYAQLPDMLVINMIIATGQVLSISKVLKN